MATAETLNLSDLATWLKGKARVVAKTDCSGGFKQIAEMVKAEIREHFERQEGPDGAAWPPLAHPRKGGRGGGPLVDSGSLLRSLIDQGHPQHVEEITPDSLTIGTTNPLAPVHDEGATVHVPEQFRGPGEKPLVFTAPDGKTVFTRHVAAHDVTIPARPFMGISEKTQEKAAEIILDLFIKEMLR